MNISLDLYTLTYFLALAAACFALYAQMRVRSVYHRHNADKNAKGVTGAETAAALLEAAGVINMKIEKTDGVLSDHFDPSCGTLRLSADVYSGKSLSAVGIAAHEAAHAIQHHEGYAPMNARQGFTRFANIGSRLAIPVALVGMSFLLSERFFAVGQTLITVGLLLFTVVVVLSIITLPVEYNATARAIAMLESNDILTEDELRAVTRVLNAAAWTYLASTLSAMTTLVRMILLSRRRR